MNRCHCQRPPVWADGDSWRSGAPAARLSQPGMPSDFLDLFALRSRTALLQSGLPHGNSVPATPRCHRRHQRSPEGRLDHRDRQRAYRRRHAPARVTDQGSFRAFLRHHSAVEKRSPRRPRFRCHPNCPAGRKSDPIGCAARSVAGQDASSILSHRFRDEGELR